MDEFMIELSEDIEIDGGNTRVKITMIVVGRRLK